MKNTICFSTILFFVCTTVLCISQNPLGIQATDDKIILFGKDTIGQGVKFFWYPAKAAFRTGGVGQINIGGATYGNNSTESYWDPENLGYFSFASGLSSRATGFSSIAIGFESIAGGDNSTALGYQTQALGDYSTSFGSGTLSLGDYSTAMGRNTEAIGDYSLAAGFGSYALGARSTAFGNSTTADGVNAVSFGSNTLAEGENSFAAGLISTASGENSIALGFQTLAEGMTSSAFGYMSEAAGNYSTAMGFQTKADGQFSTSLGGFTSARGSYSISMGNGTIATGYSSTVIGAYNDSIVSAQSIVLSDTPLFIIGNGSSLGNRSNAVVVRRDGRVGIGTNHPDYTTVVAHGNIFPNMGSDDAFSIKNEVAGKSWQFHTNGHDGWLSLYYNSTYVGGFSSSDGTYTKVSDMAFKENIRDLEEGHLKKVMKLRPVTYQMKSSSNKTENYGLIAQEVRKIFPELVHSLNGDEYGTLAITYEGLIPVLIKAIQEQQTEIDKLREKLDSLKEGNE